MENRRLRPTHRAMNCIIEKKMHKKKRTQGQTKKWNKHVEK